MSLCPKCLSRVKEDGTCLKCKSKKRDKLLIISVTIVCFLTFITIAGLLAGGAV